MKLLGSLLEGMADNDAQYGAILQAIVSDMDCRQLIARLEKEHQQFVLSLLLCDESKSKQKKVIIVEDCTETTVDKLLPAVFPEYILDSF